MSSPQTLAMSDTCDCGLKPEHKVGEHDWCCQFCGGNHTERICPMARESEPCEECGKPASIDWPTGLILCTECRKKATPEGDKTSDDI